MIFAMTMIALIVHHEIIKLFIKDEKRLAHYLKSISFYADFALKVLNIEVQVDDYKEVKQKLIVANHMSYIDVIILFSRYPSLFITSVEIRDTFLLGRITKLAGCFFVERRKSLLTKEKILGELNDMKFKLSQGHNVFLFPEGTSSDGKGVLPFKNSFFQLAIDGNVSIQPLCLNYGEKASIISWYGDMTFFSHLMKVCLEKKITAKIKQLPSIETSGQDRFTLGTLSHKFISEAYLEA